MRYDSIQRTTINKLLDKYEKSKTFLESNQVTQSFEKKVTELFPKYNDDAEYELFYEVNEALKDLERMGLVCLKEQKNKIISRVSLNTGRLAECYEFVYREPKKEEQEWLKDAMKQFGGCAVLDSYFKVQQSKMAKNQKVEYFDGGREEYLDLLKLVAALSANEEEQFVRDYSMKLFKDSKRVEKLAAKAGALMFRYGDYQEKEAVFEECGIVSTPTYVCMKGNAVLTLRTQRLDLTGLKGDIALSTATLKELDEIQVRGRRIITIENLTSFHDYADRDDFIVYLGGFHNKTKRRFLLSLYEQNPDKEYRHFGDIDAGGFYILEHLKAKTGIPFRSMHMDVETLKKYSSLTKKLTANDRKRIANLFAKQNETGESDFLTEDYREVLQYMLVRDCKLEQEIVKE